MRLAQSWQSPHGCRSPAPAVHRGCSPPVYGRGRAEAFTRVDSAARLQPGRPGASPGVGGGPWLQKSLPRPKPVRPRGLRSARAPSQAPTAVSWQRARPPERPGQRARLRSRPPTGPGMCV